MRGYKGRMYPRVVWDEVNKVDIELTSSFFFIAMPRIPKETKAQNDRLWAGINRRPIGSKADVLRAYARSVYGKYFNLVSLDRF
jgi:hypothetical protein